MDTVDVELTDRELAEPIVLPTIPPPPPRPPVPVLAAVVPVLGALVLWRLTGSAYALWFAALGPLMVGAGLVDGLRTARRARRRARRDRAIALARAEAELAHRHALERERLWRRHPDVASFAADPDRVWRAVPGRDEALVLGRGERPSAVRVDGAERDDRALALRRAARTLDDAPVTVPMGGGVAVVGPPVLAAGIVRALLLQVCLALPPGRVRLVGDDEPWADALPHRDAATGMPVCTADSGRPLPADAGILLVRVPEGASPPPRCAAVLTVAAPGRARLDADGATSDVRVEAVGVRQAAALAAGLAARARTAIGVGADAPHGLDALLSDHGTTTGRGLAAPIGIAGGRPFAIDLVADGPHAIVVGMTGAGKSELLTTWVIALCTRYDPARVGFLLVDFKGGRAFDALARLPHVTGVLTDLDDAAALRAIESLRAELRHRETVLAGVGARDVAEAGAVLGRLVVVVDEYAALVAAHPDLHDLFADLAARGRALGIHLVLSSQRAAGVFRDAVLANCPLRVSLRVTDRADSRAVLGVDDAAALSGAAGDRGLALVRRAADAAPALVRVATTAPETVATVAARPASPARRPWLPALPAVVPLERVRVAGEIVLGLADEPERQRQRPVVFAAEAAGLAIVGRPGSGKSGALHAIAAQAARAVVIPADPEAAWDTVAELDTAPPGAVVLVDDVDALLARFPPEHAGALAAGLERCAREARGRGIRLVVTAQRLTGATTRLADLLPHRALLALTSRAEHVAAGGEASGFTVDPPPGRARLDRALIQFASAPPPPAVPTPTAVPWFPARATAFIAPPGAHTRAVLEAWAERGARVVRVEDADAAPGEDGAVVWGPPEAWLAQWRRLASAREHADLVVDVACAAEHRALSGSRELPPYALPGRSRAWLCRPGDAALGARRIVLPGAARHDPIAIAGAS